MSTKSDLVMLKGVIFDMKADERTKVEEAKARFDAILKETGDFGLIALTWTALENIDE
jgi:hypothetical protein